MKIVIAMTGASGVIFGIHLLEILHDIPEVETHVIVSKWGKLNIISETEYSFHNVEQLADVVYEEKNLAAALSSGSFPIDAMIIAPCSMRTLAAISYGMADSLITRAADVTLKERRPLIIVPRETPLSTIHLENMTKLSQLGVSIVPPMPAFYNHPQTISDIVHHICVRILDQLHINVPYAGRWEGELKTISQGRSPYYADNPRISPERSPHTKAAFPSIDDTGDTNTSNDATFTIMWEVTTSDTAALLDWVKSTQYPTIMHYDPRAEVEIYSNNDNRVVVIATGNLTQAVLAQPPENLVQRTPHCWNFQQQKNWKKIS